jgi:hypothetical protein
MPSGVGVDAVGVVGMVGDRHDVEACGVGCRGAREQVGYVGEPGFEAHAEQCS